MNPELVVGASKEVEKKEEKWKSLRAGRSCFNLKTKLKGKDW